MNIAIKDYWCGIPVDDEYTADGKRVMGGLSRGDTPHMPSGMEALVQGGLSRGDTPGRTGRNHWLDAGLVPWRWVGLRPVRQA